MGKKRIPKAPIKLNDPYRQRISTATDLIGRLFDDMSQFNYHREILLPLTESIQELQDNFKNKNMIISGTASCGKTSTILWLCKNLDFNKNHLITIDCMIYETDVQFIDCLAKQIGLYIKRQNFGKNLVINENINFNALNEFILSGEHKFIIILKFAEKLIRPRQLLLYNFFQWINNNHIKEYISVIICTRTITFYQKLQKRIQSRVNIPFYYIPLPKPATIIQIIVKRIQNRMDNTEDEDEVKLLQKLQRAIQNNKDLDKLLQFQYKYSPRGIVFYLKMMQLLLIQDLDLERWQKSNDTGLKVFVAQSFKRNCEFISQYKEISKNIYKNLPFPEIVLLGLIRRRFLRQKKGNFTIQSTLKSFYQDFNQLRTKNALQTQGSNFNYGCVIFQAALQHLAQINFLTISQNQGLNVFYKQIKSQYSPQDIKQFYASLKDLPNFIKEIYLQI